MTFDFTLVLRQQPTAHSAAELPRKLMIASRHGGCRGARPVVTPTSADLGSPDSVAGPTGGSVRSRLRLRQGPGVDFRLWCIFGADQNPESAKYVEMNVIEPSAS